MSTKPLRIYIAAPYTLGDVGENLNRVLKAADFLVAMGHIPYIPHLNHFWHVYSPKEYTFWLDYDKTFLLHWAEALLRLDGKSEGADREELTALKKGLLIFHSLEEVYLVEE